MKRELRTKTGSFNPRALLAFALCSGGVLLTVFSFSPPAGGRHSLSPKDAGSRQSGQPQGYMPVPGGKADDLDRMEVEWNTRLTYPTGVFNPAWLRLAAIQDALI